jgi:hypothetical protein
MILAMALVSPTKLSDEEKLETLQRLDRFRQWHSLDEKRYCLVCGKIITGREIQVIGGRCGNGPLRIICSTERCNAIPMDWVRPTDEVMVKIAMMEAERRDVPPPQVHRRTREHSIASRFRKFAVHLKGSA